VLVSALLERLQAGLDLSGEELLLDVAQRAQVRNPLHTLEHFLVVRVLKRPEDQRILAVEPTFYGLGQLSLGLKASPRAKRVALVALYGVFLCFSEIRQERLKPLNIRNACGERLEKRSLHPPLVPARDLPLGAWAYNRCLAWS
jgi:hypothetical protein